MLDSVRLARALRASATKQGIAIADLPAKLLAWTDEQWATAEKRAGVELSPETRLVVIAMIKATPASGGVDWYPDDMPRDGGSEES